MANEHVLMTQKTFPISMTCANATGIEKGAVLYMADLNTAATTTGVNQVIGGIAYTEKIAGDGNTSISVLSGPGDELKAIASGSIGVGDPLGTATAGFANYLYSVKDVLSLSGSVIIGYSKETATVGETFKYVLNISTPSYAVS